jgi:hypothetical protein
MAEPALVADARIDYQRIRISPEHRLAGRAKVTISLAAWIGVARLPAALTDLCERVRREIITVLVQQGIPLHGIEFALDWRERWVGPHQYRLDR